MNLPKAVSDLIKAQENLDSTAFANCFSDSAAVSDEGKTYKGNMEIQRWNEKTNSTYQTVLQPVDYEDAGAKGILTTKVSGTFDGSPIILKYHFTIADGFIQSLKITG